MTALGQLFGQHVPRDRHDDEGHPVGTYCVCGGWEGDYFADGEAGPFDEHLAAVVLAAGWKAPEAAVEVPVSDSGALDDPFDDGDDYRRRACLFNDITHVPLHDWINFSDRRAMADHLWAQGWRRDVRPEDVTEKREARR